MSSNLIALLLVATIGQYPGGGGSPYGGGAVYTAPDSTHAFGTGDPLYPYDHEAPWMHGYYQEIPAYGGYHFFRPYNYRHVMPQSQTAAAWGMSPNMPYSHQYFDRASGVMGSYPNGTYTAPGTTPATGAPSYQSIPNPGGYTPGGYSPAPGGYTPIPGSYSPTPGIPYGVPTSSYRPVAPSELSAQMAKIDREAKRPSSLRRPANGYVVRQPAVQEITPAGLRR